MKYWYPTIITKDHGGVYTITVVDVPGCLGSSMTLDMPMDKARDSLLFHKKLYGEEGVSFPEPSELDDHADAAKQAGGTVGLLSVEFSEIL